MIRYKITDAWRKYAEKKYTGHEFNETTIKEGGDGQIAGTIGELAVGHWLKELGHDFDYVADTSMDHDFVVCGQKIDVKTKHSVGHPQLHYMVRVPYSQQNQDCDAYIFTYCTSDEVFLLGWEDKDDWWAGRKTFEAKAGDVVDGFTELVHCRYAFVGDLIPLHYLDLSFVAA